MTLLETRDLHVVRPSGYHLRAPDLRLSAGQVGVLEGPNGSGKTTCLKCLGGLLVPRSGEVRLAGRCLYGAFGPRRSVQRMAVYVNAEPFLFPGTVLRNLLLGPRWRGIDRRHAVALVGQEARAAGLERLLHSPSHTLSRGQARRVALVRALVARPRILLLDEPDSDLDEEGRNWLLDRVAGFAASGGTVLVATHQGALWRRVAGPVLRLEQSGSGSWLLRPGTA